MTNQTIGQAAKEREIKPDTFKKRIDRALKDTEIRQKLGIKADIKTGLRDPFTSELAALLAAPAKKSKSKEKAKGKTKAAPIVVPKLEDQLNPVVISVAKADNPPPFSSVGHSALFPTKPPRRVRRIPTQIPTFRRLKSRQKPVPNPDIIQIEIPTPKSDTDNKPDNLTITARFFQSEIIALSSLSVLILSDGFSMSLLAGRTFDDNLIAFALFTVVGLIIGYSAISTTRTAHAAPKKNWEKGYFGFWIILFAIFQTALHGSAFEMFGNWSEMIGRSLIVISIPLATASLTTTILKR